MKKHQLQKFFITVFLLVVVAGAIAAFLFWRAVYKSNVTLVAGEEAYLFVPTGSDFDAMMQLIDDSGIVQNTSTFAWLAHRKNLPNHVYPGRYAFVAGMSNEEMINMLRAGHQKPLNVTFNNLRTVQQLAGNIAKQIEADSLSIIQYIDGKTFRDKYGLSPWEAAAMFVPNTYEFYWNTTAEAFAERMHREYQKFWNEERKAKARKLKRSELEVIILASIVDKETNRVDEMATIAGVYLNRLQQGWRLQADPTTVFAFYLENDSILNRVLKVHTQMQSPYNTYVHHGLPPGPISLPPIHAIDAVLNAEKHDYMFFVARADGSGYHHFSKTYRQHLNYARQFHKSLDSRQ
jgi:UPF0755 protein